MTNPDRRRTSATTPASLFAALPYAVIAKGIIYLTPDYSSGSYLLMQRAIPPQPRGGCYAR